jgi:phosphoribosylformimino-5-aminoimidazole carboxamide ribotide isomerase
LSWFQCAQNVNGDKEYPMDVIPAIDLLGGRCVRLYQGDYEQSEVFAEDPVTVAIAWAEQGARWLHLVDLDGAKTGEPVNLSVIAKIVETLNIPVQVGGGLRTQARVASFLEMGVARVILGTVAVENPDLVAQLCQTYPDQIVVGIDAREGMVATRGWLETSKVSAIALGQRVASEGAAAIIYTDIQRDGTLQGPNLPLLRGMAEAVSVPVIASGGVSNLTDILSLLALEPIGVSGVIVGKALYTGDLSLAEALRAIGPGRWQDVPTDLGQSSWA